MLRLFQAGITISDLHEMTVGMAEDILIEMANDMNEITDDIDGETTRDATQEDIDEFIKKGW
jgi:hypothetical protein